MFSMTAFRKCALCILALVFLVNVRVAVGANPDVPTDLPTLAESPEEEEAIEYSLFPKGAPGCEVVVREAQGVRTIHTKDGVKIITVFLGRNDEITAVEIGGVYTAMRYADDRSGRPVGFVTNDGVVHSFNNSPDVRARGARAAKNLVDKLAGKVCSRAKQFGTEFSDMSEWASADYWEGVWDEDQVVGLNDWFNTYSYAAKTCQERISDCLFSCDMRSVGEVVLCGVAAVGAGSVTAGFGTAVGIVCAAGVGAARAMCADQCRRLC